MLKNSPQKKWKRSRFGTYSGWKKSCTNWWFIPYIYIYTRIYIYIFVGFQQVSKIQSAGFLPSVGVRFAFWQPRNLASRPEIRHENLRCSVVHIRKTGGYQRQGSELSQVGDILRVRFLFSSILQPSDDSHLMSLLLLLCIHFFFGGSLALLREWVARRAMNAVGGAMEVLSGEQPHWWHDRSSRFISTVMQKLQIAVGHGFLRTRIVIDHGVIWRSYSDCLQLVSRCCCWWSTYWLVQPRNCFWSVWVWVKLEKPQNCKLQTEDWHFFFCHRGGECLCQPQLQIRLNRYSEARFFWINCQNIHHDHVDWPM